MDEDKVCGDCRHAMASIAGYEYIVCPFQPLGSPGRLRSVDALVEDCEYWEER